MQLLHESIQVGQLVRLHKPLRETLGQLIGSSDYIIDEFFVGRAMSPYRLFILSKSVVLFCEKQVWQFDFNSVEISLNETKGGNFLQKLFAVPAQIELKERGGDKVFQFHAGQLISGSTFGVRFDRDATVELVAILNGLIDVLKSGISQNANYLAVVELLSDNSTLQPRTYTGYTSQQRLIIDDNRVNLLASNIVSTIKDKIQLTELGASGKQCLKLMIDGNDYYIAGRRGLEFNDAKTAEIKSLLAS